jgi:hypothetical protein
MVSASQDTISHELSTSINHKQPSKPSALTQTTPGDQYMPCNHIVRNGIALTRNGLLSDIISTSRDVTKLLCSLHAPTKTQKMYSWQPWILYTTRYHSFYIDVQSIFAGRNTTQNHNCTTSKHIIFDIKTSVNETINNNPPDWRRISIFIFNHAVHKFWGIVLDIVLIAATNVCIWTVWTVADVMLQLVTGKIFHMDYMQHNGVLKCNNNHSIAASCRFAKYMPSLMSITMWLTGLHHQCCNGRS